jgi:hypothetical protein
MNSLITPTKTGFPTDDVDAVGGASELVFRISKYTLPLLNSPFVPASRYDALDESR